MSRFHREALDYLEADMAATAAAGVAAAAMAQRPTSGSDSETSADGSWVKLPQGKAATSGSAASSVPPTGLKPETIGGWLDARDYDESLAEGWLLPFCAAVWSKPMSGAREMDAASLFVFLRNHGFLTWNMLKWYTPKGRCGGGYLPRVEEWFAANRVEVRLGCRVTSAEHVDGPGGGEPRIRLAAGVAELGVFDRVVFATPAGVLNDVVSQVRPGWSGFLAGFRSNGSEVVLHSDKSVMPVDKTWWTSWTVDESVLTYWLNNLQHLDTDTEIFETLNPTRELTDVHCRWKMAHPVMDRKTTLSQRQYFAETSETTTGRAGHHQVRLAGAYLHHAFHEDGFRSGIEAARGVLGDLSIPLHPVPYARFHPIHHQCKDPTLTPRSGRSLGTSNLLGLTVVQASAIIDRALPTAARPRCRTGWRTRSHLPYLELGCGYHGTVFWILQRLAHSRARHSVAVARSQTRARRRTSATSR